MRLGDNSCGGWSGRIREERIRRGLSIAQAAVLVDRSHHWWLNLERGRLGRLSRWDWRRLQLWWPEEFAELTPADIWPVETDREPHKSYS